MTPAFYEDLKGEMTLEEWDVASKTVGDTAKPPVVNAQPFPKSTDDSGTIGYGP